jgi:deoxyadenosine/deoxycytidine kinase
MSGSLNARMANQKTGVVVEIIGPAGAGKSTLFDALGKKITEIHCEFLPPVWSITYLPFFIKNFFLLLPTLLSVHGDRGLSRRELAWMAILNGWPGILERRINQGFKVILLDQGPIFLIAILAGFGPKSLHEAKVNDWWERIIDRWAQTLDIIVWLDSSNEILTRRIRERERDHLVKEKSNREIQEFIVKYRMLYEGVTKQIIAKNPNLRLIRIDTGQYAINEIINKIRSEINL